jgi:hypothetical protein
MKGLIEEVIVGLGIFCWTEKLNNGYVFHKLASTYILKFLKLLIENTVAL